MKKTHWTTQEVAHMLTKMTERRLVSEPLPFASVAADLSRTEKSVRVKWGKLTKRLKYSEVIALRDRLNSTPAQAPHA